MTPSLTFTRPRPPVVLCLDLGTKTGWAMNCDPMLSGTAEFAPRRFEGGGMRFLRFVGWLDEIAGLAPIQAVYFEEVASHKGTAAAHIYGGLMAHLTAWCERRRNTWRIWRR